MSTGAVPERHIICGSRDFKDRALVDQVVTELVKDAHRRSVPIVIVHGACPTGADYFADQAAQKLQRAGYEVAIEKHPFDGSKGRAGGPIRNRGMARLGAKRCHAFWDGTSSGTVSMIGEATLAKIPVDVRPEGYRL